MAGTKKDLKNVCTSGYIGKPPVKHFIARHGLGSFSADRLQTYGVFMNATDERVRYVHVKDNAGKI
jgi:hypothetical protein